MMKLRLILTVVACAACQQAQTPAEKAWNILTTGAQDKSFEKRGKSVHALGLLPGDARAEAAAAAALKDEREEARATAADVLGVMKAKAYIPNLIAAVKDP
jgi:HEAT repeat protein